jgi:hypothetical protein
MTNVLRCGQVTFSALTQDASKYITDIARSICETLDIEILGFGPDHQLQDIDGYYTDFFAQRQLSSLIIRPDKYIFGEAAQLRDVSRLISDLAHHIPAPA